MKKNSQIIIFSILLILLALKMVIAQSEPPLLEEYSFQFGNSAGTEFLFHDRRLGNGTAQLRIRLVPDRANANLRVEVFRHHSSGIVFALLLEKIEIQFLNSSGNPIKSLVLDQVLGENGLFIIGDSDDGYFQHENRITDVSAVRAMRIRVFGNYE
jgi:hypothetical protein